MLKLADVKDIVLSLSVLYFSVWLYEIGNWISLTLSGSRASLLWSGVFPVGVMGTSSLETGYLGAKILQIGICVGVALLAASALRGKDLPVTNISLAGVTGMYIGSVYWEMFSLTSSVPMVLHETVFIGLGVTAAFGSLRVFQLIPGADSSYLKAEARVLLRRPVLALHSLNWGSTATRKDQTVQAVAARGSPRTWMRTTVPRTGWNPLRYAVTRRKVSKRKQE